jgi:hypothetical protein
MCILGVAATAERGSLLDKFHHLQGLRWWPAFGYMLDGEVTDPAENEADSWQTCCFVTRPDRINQIDKITLDRNMPTAAQRQFLRVSAAVVKFRDSQVPHSTEQSKLRCLSSLDLYAFLSCAFPGGQLLMLFPRVGRASPENLIHNQSPPIPRRAASLPPSHSARPLLLRIYYRLFPAAERMASRMACAAIERR